MRAPTIQGSTQKNALRILRGENRFRIYIYIYVAILAQAVSYVNTHIDIHTYRRVRNHGVGTIWEPLPMIFGALGPLAHNIFITQLGKCLAKRFPNLVIISVGPFQAESNRCVAEARSEPHGTTHEPRRQ